MTKRKDNVIILCEDRQQQVFARYFLIKRGFNVNKIIPLDLPAGKISGEQYVRQQYPIQVRAYRRKSTYRSVCLVVLMDADTKTVEECLKLLDNALEQDGQERRQPEEKIAIFIPKRNIETWIYYLQGNLVNEEQAYRKLNEESDCKPCVDSLIEQCPQGLNADAPPSLYMACAEIQRILS